MRTKWGLMVSGAIWGSTDVISRVLLTFPGLPIADIGRCKNGMGGNVAKPVMIWAKGSPKNQRSRW